MKSGSPSTPKPATEASYVVFTDLDGTLLDHDSYAYEESLPGIRRLKEHGVPLVFCSAKTRAEQLPYREALDIHDPFIVENGAAIFVEKEYFKKPPSFSRQAGSFDVLEFGRPYSEIREILSAARERLGLRIRGYGDLTLEEVAGLTGLDLDAASRAVRREYEETVVTPLEESDRRRLGEVLSKSGVGMVSGARFISVSAANDKGRAVAAVAEMYRGEGRNVMTVGIGDSWNDEPMLRATDISMLVQRPDETWAPLHVDGIRRIDGIGPKGWSRAMHELIRA